MTPMAAIQSSFIFLLYFLIRVIGSPLFVLYFLYRGYRDRRYFGTIGERLGHLPPSFQRTVPGSIWLHAVSVGEAISAVRLIEELRRANPAIPIFVSTTTLAGRAVAQQKIAPLVDGIFYVPIDYGFAIRRVLRTIRPAVLVVLETEIWPMLWRETKRAGCGLIVLNGRISDRAWPRYRKFRFLFAPILRLPDAILTQSEADERRYSALEATRARAFGNLKYDGAPSQVEPPKFVQELVDRVRPTAVWIAASTMPGLNTTDVDEDDVVISAFRHLAETNPGLLLILVPRKPERFAGAAAKLQEAGVRFMRRSDKTLTEGFTLPAVLLLDSMGELASLFSLADVVFMGGTLANRGGHNVLEPAIAAKAIIVGPHMENFAEIAADFHAHDAWFPISGPDQLIGAVETLLGDAERRSKLGARAAELAVKNTGVASRAAQEILTAQDLAVPYWDRPGVSALLLWPLAQLWKYGNLLKQRSAVRRARSLNRPVISVGGISLGGTGKTPFAEMLAKSMRTHGLQPAILTRGYRRRSLDEFILVRAGTQVSTAYTGDEAQIFVRTGDAHVGIGSDRWQAGRLIEERFGAGAFLLDDGFQHRRLRRDLDIVLIDALNPFPGQDVFPMGMMREPLSGLARAGAFVITRAQPGREYEGIRMLLRRVNRSAPVFTASVEARGWIHENDRRPATPPVGPVVAFCGLANPDTFWNSLREEGFDPVFTWQFGDHHHYRPYELRRLADQAKQLGAEALLTTEKDAMNLPENACALVAPLSIYWLKIATVVHEQEELVALIEAASATRGSRGDAGVGL
jgi:tetraacyldisaccharide 4'-kinase